MWGHRKNNSHLWTRKSVFTRSQIDLRFPASRAVRKILLFFISYLVYGIFAACLEKDTNSRQVWRHWTFEGLASQNLGTSAVFPCPSVLKLPLIEKSILPWRYFLSVVTTMPVPPVLPRWVPWRTTWCKQPCTDAHQNTPKPLQLPLTEVLILSWSLPSIPL